MAVYIFGYPAVRSSLAKIISTSARFCLYLSFDHSFP